MCIYVYLLLFPKNYLDEPQPSLETMRAQVQLPNGQRAAINTREAGVSERKSFRLSVRKGDSDYANYSHTDLPSLTPLRSHVLPALKEAICVCTWSRKLWSIQTGLCPIN